MGNVAQKAVNLAFLVVLARLLALDDMGAWAFAGAYATFFTTVADLGIDGVATRELVAREPAERGLVLGSAMVAKLMACLLAIAVAAGASAAYGPDLRLPALIAVMGILSTVPGTASLLLVADVRPAAAVVVRFVGLVATVAVVLVAAYGDAGVPALVAMQTAVGFLTSAAVYAVVQRRVPVRLSADRGVVRELVVAGLPLAAATVGIVVFARVDQLLLGVLATSAEVARYGVSVRVVDAFNVLPTAIGAVALPALTSRRGTGDGGRGLARRGYRWLAAGMLPVAALGTVVGGDVLGWVFGRAYAEAGTTLSVLLWAHYFAFAWVLTRQVLLATGRTGSLAVLALAAAGANVVLNLILIPANGAEGAAVASLLAYGGPFLVAPLLPGLRDDLLPALVAAWRPMVAAGAVLLSLVVLRWLVPQPAILLAAFVVLDPLALLATRSIDRRDLAHLRAAVSLRSERV